MDISTFQSNLDFIKGIYFHEEWKDEKCWEKIIEILVDANTKIEKAFGESIHMACDHKPSAEAIEKVLKKFPSTSSHVLDDEVGQIPDVSDLPDLSAPVKQSSSGEDEEEEEFQADDEESGDEESEEDINMQVSQMLEKETDMLSIDEKSLQDSEYFSEEDDDKLGTQPLNEEDLLGNDSYSQSSESEEEVPKLKHLLRKKDKCPNYAESDEDYQSETDDDDLVEYTPSKTPGRWKRKYERKNTENTKISESTHLDRPNYAESDEDYQSETDEDDIIYLNHVRRKQIRAKVKEEASRGRKKRSKSSRDDDYESEDDL